MFLRVDPHFNAGADFDNPLGGLFLAGNEAEEDAFPRAIRPNQTDPVAVPQG